MSPEWASTRLQNKLGKVSSALDITKENQMKIYLGYLQGEGNHFQKSGSYDYSYHITISDYY